MRIRLQYVIIGLGLGISCTALAQQTASPPATAPAISDSPIAQSAPVPQGDQSRSQQHETSPTQKPVVLNPSKPPQEQQPSGDRGDGGKRIGTDDGTHGLNETIIANFTIVLAFATVLLMLATGGLWWETRKLASQAKIASEDTKKSIELATSANEREFRSYIRLDVRSGEVRIGKKAVFDVSAVNYGRTPANKFAFAGSVVTRAPNWKWDKNIDLVSTDERPNHTIHPGGDNILVLNSEFIITQEIYDQVRSGNLVIFGRGVAFYEDVTGAERETHISIEFSGDESFKRSAPRIADTGNFAT